MTTDLFELTALLDKWEVPYVRNATVETQDGGPGAEVFVGRDYLFCLPHGKVDGYTGFYTRFLFSVAGEFVRMGAWE